MKVWKIQLFISCLLLSLCFPNTSMGQSPATSIETPVHLRLARLWANEAGVDASHWRDHASITHVIRRVGRGEVTNQAICTYSSKICRVRRRNPRRQWVNELNLEGTKPRHWPRHVSWDNHQEDWLKMLKRAQMYIEHTPRACNRRPYHWGAKNFNEDYWLSQGWERLRCGNALNWYWAPPRR